MPKNNLYATATTHRAHGASSFFLPCSDATAQDCKELAIQLIEQCTAIAKVLDCSDEKQPLQRALIEQLRLTVDVLNAQNFGGVQ